MNAPDPCISPKLNANALEETIWDTVVGVINDPEILLEEFTRRQTQQHRPDYRNDLRRKLQQEARQLEEKIDRFLDLYGDGNLDKDALDGKIDQVTKRRMAIEKELAQMNANEVNQQKIQEASENLEEFCRTVSKGADNLNFEERQQLLRLVVHRTIIKDKSHICIELALPLGPDKNISQLRPKRCAYQEGNQGPECPGGQTQQEAGDQT